MSNHSVEKKERTIDYTSLEQSVMQELTECLGPHEEALSAEQHKMIKSSRKDHECCTCQRRIDKGSSYLMHSAIVRGESVFFKQRICVDCIEFAITEYGIRSE